MGTTKELAIKIENWMFDDGSFFFFLAKGFLIFGIGIALAMALVAGIYRLINGPVPTATINLNDFACTAAHTEVTVAPMGLMLVPISRSVCDQYTRVK